LLIPRRPITNRPQVDNLPHAVSGRWLLAEPSQLDRFSD
jgi:hypothetical protein